MAARRIAARRSQADRGDIDPRFSTGMPWAPAMRMAMPVPPVAGLLGPIAIAVYAAVLSVPVWTAWWWLAHKG